MTPLTLYHNPRCSKSRAALELLTARGLKPRVVAYLDTPPDPPTLRELLRLLQRRPRALMRTGESVYEALGLDAVEDDDALIEAMCAHPVLIERPIVTDGERAVIGRPPENVLTLLDD